MRSICIFIFLFSFLLNGKSQNQWQGKFEQLDEILPTPNSYRTGSGAPGANYWQQRADYVISAEVNDDTQLLTGSETITYHNNAPESLRFLWLQLDQNIFADQSIMNQTRTGTVKDSIPAAFFNAASGVMVSDYKGGYTIKSVKDASGKNLPYTINNTMMRVDLPAPLKTGEKFVFSVDWNYTEYDRQVFNGRGGYEFFPEDGNYVYTFAQWFPRMCVFDDFEGWQNKQFLGQGEFALTFGNYRVRITVPADHIVGATGTIQNPKDVLSKQQLEQYEKAKKTFDAPVFIVTQKEAIQKEKNKSSKKATWEFYAENVRDFAFASSRKFIWDAQAVKVGNKTPLAQSLYPKEGNPLWERESTKAIKNALEIYSERTFEYPYPVAYSVHTANQGMEYPMICFNGERPKNGSYSKATLTGLVQVVVHEIGHNFFPMIVNSDERQWSWMDEGLNTFLEKETTRIRYPELYGTHGTPKGIIPYMRGDKNQMRPIMASSDNVRPGEFGSNAYTKPSAALTVLRETVIGPELFDQAFKEYAQRWAFKHPGPADFFRTMEDVSAVDLDWFWRGWFYTTDNVDVDMAEVKWFKLRSEKLDPERKKLKVKQGDLETEKAGRNESINDFSNGPEEFNLTDTPDKLYGEFKSRLNDNTIRQKLEGKNIYQIKFKNVGGLVTPLVIEWTYKDGSKEIERIPAEVWRMNETEITKVFIKDKEVVNIVLDPNFELADIEMRNNIFPKKATPSRFDQFKKNN